jgi:hypothetical protein
MTRPPPSATNAIGLPSEATDRPAINEGPAPEYYLQDVGLDRGFDNQLMAHARGCTHARITAVSVKQVAGYAAETVHECACGKKLEKSNSAYRKDGRADVNLRRCVAARTAKVCPVSLLELDYKSGMSAVMRCEISGLNCHSLHATHCALLLAYHSRFVALHSPPPLTLTLTRTSLARHRRS